MSLEPCHRRETAPSNHRIVHARLLKDGVSLDKKIRRCSLPQTVTGGSMYWTFPSWHKISRAFAHKTLTSGSLRTSHFMRISIWWSKSLIVSLVLDGMSIEEIMAENLMRLVLMERFVLEKSFKKRESLVSLNYRIPWFSGKRKGWFFC